MSGTIETTAKIVIIGSLVGIAGLVAIGTLDRPAEATQAPQPAQVAAPVVTVEEEPAAAAHALEVNVATSGSIRSNMHGFATIAVEATMDVAEAKLLVDCATACEIVKVPQADWSSAGAGVRVNLGEMAAGEVRPVLVVFEVDGDVSEFSTRTSYRDLHVDSRPTVISQPTTQSLSRLISNPEVYLDARLALSADAADEARELMEGKDYADALDLVDRAYETNVKVGMALRFSGKLRGAQDEFDGIRAEIAQLTKPKPKKRAPKPKTIDIVRGDR